MQPPYFALFDDAAAAQARLLEEYCGSVRLAAAEIDKLDGILHEGWAQNRHACLILPYEFGTALHFPRYAAADGTDAQMSVHWFARETLLDETALAAWLDTQTDGGRAGIAALTAGTDETGYLKTVADIRAAIARGEIYQANYTVRLHADSYGSPAALYRRLRARQAVPYAFFARLPEAEPWTLSLSPELFLRILPDGTVETEPMKGTAPVLNDGRDEERAQALAQDPKNRAENVMIVDLLRNDLGRLAETGGVSIPERFTVRRFGQVWQMTSLVRARIRPQTRIAELLSATFPCGSITGAPKRMSMEKIRTWENAPRGLYTGSIGYLKPCASGLGYAGVFNVAIRTLCLSERESGLYRGRYGVGSGIVTDSDAAAEYRECGWKSRLLSGLAPEFSLIESMAAADGRCPLLPLHRRRLEQSAAALRFPPLPEGFWEQAAREIAKTTAPAIIRLCHSADGAPEIAIRPLNDSVPPFAVIARQRLPVRQFLRRFKTSDRRLFDQVWQAAVREGAFDALFFNEEGFLLEGGRSSVFLKCGGRWYTPPLSLDILDGVMRRAILDNPAGYLNTAKIEEKPLRQQDLEQAEAIVLANAVRGAVTVRLLDGKTV